MRKEFGFEHTVKKRVGVLEESPDLLAKEGVIKLP
jgi:hypothetical protein